LSRKTWITLAIVLIPVAGLVLASIFGAGQGLQRFHNANFIIAFAIGATLTVLLSVGLFTLTFLSSRRGYDDRVGLAPNEEVESHIDDDQNVG
jgi:choline-glycine betaine transporter